MIRLTQILNEVKEEQGSLNELKFKLPKFKDIKKRLKKFKPFKKPKKTSTAFDAKNKKAKNKFMSLIKKMKRLTEASDDKILALAMHLDIDHTDEDIDLEDEIQDNGYAFDAEGGEYLVLTDSEADERAKDYILESVWSFNTWFLLDHITQEEVNSYLGLEDKYYDEDEEEYVEIGDDEEVFYMNMGIDLEEYIKSLQNKYESGNDEILNLIDDVDDFVDSAISVDGRGHFMASYDGEENEQNGYYIYRIN